MGLTNNLGKLSNMITSTGSAVGIGTSSVTEGTQAASSISIFPLSSVSSGPLIQFASNGRIRPASTGDRLSIDGNALYLNSYISGDILMNTAGGNVGIGTSAPTSKLHITSSNADVFTTLETNAAYSAYNRNKNGNRSWVYGVDGSSSSWIVLDETAGAVRMAVTTAGNVGIGTSTPTTFSGYTVLSINNSSQGGIVELQSVGTSALRMACSVADSAVWEPRSVPFLIGVGGAERIRVTSTGRVGIGTSNPGTALEVNGRYRTTSTYSSSGTTVFEIYNTSSTGYGLYMAAGAGTNYAFKVADYANTERFTVLGNGDVGIGISNPADYKLTIQTANTTQDTGSLIIKNSSGAGSLYVFNVSGTGTSTSASQMWVQKHSSTNRSINAAGTINALGTDYAEYMLKSNSNIIFAKGDIIGIDQNGLLTNNFNESKSFVVKSTNPSYVGGDSWFTEMKPEKTENETEEEYLIAVAEWEQRYQDARKTVDRIAFSGQVPCNIQNANVGDYIIPIELDGKISGISVTNPTFEQYQISVGKVWKITEDGRAWIVIKIG